jgi:serine/threonine-protein kinase RsbW
MKRPPNKAPSKLKLAHAVDASWNEVQFNSCLNRAREVEEEILGECRKHGYGEDDLFGVKLALEEALVNAVKHGNRMDKEKVVRVRYRVTDQRADVTIEDQGEGFSPADLPDPTDEENLCRCSGRGILLMRAYMSSVVFNPRGNMVTLTLLNKTYNVATG